MRVRIYGLLGVVFSSLALFLPWISCTLNTPALDYPTQIVCVWAADSALLCVNLTWSTFYANNNSLICAGATMVWVSLPPPVSEIIWDWACGLTGRRPFLGLSYLLWIVALLLCIYSIGIAAQGILANGSWGKVGRKALTFSGFLLLAGVLLRLISCVFFWPVSIIYEGFSLYPNIGFFIAVLSAILLFVSSRRPKLIDIPVKIEAEKLRRWFMIPEREKVAVVFLNSFLGVYLFTIFYFVLPSITPLG